MILKKDNVLFNTLMIDQCNHVFTTLNTIPKFSTIEKLAIFKIFFIQKNYQIKRITVGFYFILFYFILRNKRITVVFFFN